jgi:hypothetical protein
MAKITKQNVQDLLAVVNNKDAVLAVRKKAYADILDATLNPRATKDFDPDTWDPHNQVEAYEIKRRARVVPPKRLPTLGMRPKEVMQGQMIGMYESKQDLYLMIAWLSERVSDLEDALKALQVKPK